MDGFDEFNQTTQETETLDEQNTNHQEVDLFGSEYTDNTTTVASINPFSNEQQHQQDLSWDIDDDLANTTTTSQTNIFDDNTLDNLSSAPQTTLFDDDIFTSQSNTNEFDSYPTTNLPPTTNELLYDDSTRRSSENNLSSNMFSHSASSSPNINQLNSTEDLSPSQAFHIRRQQEIAEMDVIEKQKIEELRQQGKKDLERWYEDRRIRMEQKLQSIRKEEDVTVTQALEKSDKNTCDWAKIIRLIDFSQGTQITKQKRDLNRMRAVIIQAKRDKDDRKSENGV